MIVERNSEEHQPLGWVGSVPLYVTTLLVTVICVAMTVEAVLRGVGVANVGQWLVFSPELTFCHFHFWRLFTYPFLNEPSIWFLIEMGMFLLFGREVERSIGRSDFLLLYGALVLVPPACVSVLYLLGMATLELAGSWNINFATFVSFVALYPRAEIFFGIMAKWVAVALVGIRSLELLENKVWIALVVFWLECLIAILLIRAHCSGTWQSLWRILRWIWPMSSLRTNLFLKKPREKISSLKTPEESKEKGDPEQSVDIVLEKISQRGIGSLTPSERACLEKARTTLLERERHP